MQRGSPAALNGHSSTGFFFHPERRKFAKRPQGGIGSSKRAAGNGARCQMAFSAVVFEVKNVSGQANRTAAWIRICSSRGNMASAILDDIIQSLKKQVSFGLVFLRFAYASLLGGGKRLLTLQYCSNPRNTNNDNNDRVIFYKFMRSFRLDERLHLKCIYIYVSVCVCVFIYYHI